MDRFSRDAPLSVAAGRRAGDAVSPLEQGIQPIADKAAEEGGNRLLSGFEAEKKKSMFDPVDKKRDDVARWKVVFVRGGCKTGMRRPCHKPGGETHQAKKLAGLDVLCEGRTVINHG